MIHFCFGRLRLPDTSESAFTCYNSAKRPESSQTVRKLPKMHSFSSECRNRNGFYKGRFSPKRDANSDAFDCHEVSPHLCKILTLIMVKTYLQKGRRRYRIARRLVVTCYNSTKPPGTSKCVSERPKMHSFSAGRTRRNGLYN